MNIPSLAIGLKMDVNYPSGRKPIILTITFKRERKRLLIKQTAHPDMWDAKSKRCTSNDPESETINRVISDWEGTAKQIITKFKTNAELNQLLEIPESVNDIHREILIKKKPEDKKTKNLSKLNNDLQFFEYAAEEIDRLGDLKQYGLQARYSSAVNKYKRWCIGERLMSEMTTEDIQNYHAKYLVKKLGNEKSTAHVSVRILKTIYRRAKRKYPYLEQYPDPFVNANIKLPKNDKEVDRLTFEDIQKLGELELNGTLDRSRDIFLFCYECLGIRVSDAISLKKSQIKTVITFNVRKTDKLLKAEITPYMRLIIDKYKDNTTYLFGLLDKSMDEAQIAQQIKSSTALINKDLKKIGKIANLSIPPEKMRTHLARHTLAHHVYAETNNIQLVKIICQHEDIRITEGYVGRLGFEQVTEKMQQYRQSIKKKGFGLKAA